MITLGKPQKFSISFVIFSIALFPFLWSSCSSKFEGTNYNRIKVIKTTRDSLFYLKDQLFSGAVNHYDLHGSQVRFFEVQEGKLNGEYRVFDAKGWLMVLATYHDGVLHGSWLAYKGDQLIERLNYSYNLMHGKRELFWENGLLKEENYFDHGVLTGRSNYFFSNGKLRKTFAFDAIGNRDGDWMDYHPNGKIKQKISYQSGKIIDSLVRYNIKGEILIDQ